MCAKKLEYCQGEAEVALTVLRRYDIACEEVLWSGAKVKVYDYDLGSPRGGWIPKAEAEGSLYLVRRSQSSFYKLVILSQYNKPGSFPKTTDIPISQHCISHSHQQYYMFKNEAGNIQAIMFPSKSDCDRFSQKIDSVMKELKRGGRPNVMDSQTTRAVGNGKPQDIPKKPTSDNNDEDKILSLLECARQRYKDGQNRNGQVSSSTPDRRSRQIDINDLFTTMTSDSGTNTNPHPPTYKLTSTNFPSYPPNGRTTGRTMSLDLPDDNASTAFTVTELEKYFVQGASVKDGIKKSRNEGDDSDDDMQLLDPKKLTAEVIRSQKEELVTALTKDQLKETLIHILQNDDEDGGLFLSRLHNAYLDLYHKTRTVSKK